MYRTNFYHKLTVDSIEELDFLWNSLSEFKDAAEYQPEYYRVVAGDLKRPDLISYKCYGTVDFWWILMIFNNIENPLTDLEAGMLLEIPSEIDIYNFQRKYRVRRSR